MGSYPHIHRLVHPLPGPYPLLPPPDLDKEGRVDNQRDTPPNTRLTVQPIRATSVDFAQIIKSYGSDGDDRKYSPASCNGMEKVVVWGSPNLDTANTSYVERQNLTMRMGMRRFTRLTNAFSKRMDKHCAMLALYYYSYNHVKPHGSVRTKGNNRITPAMAAGIATRPATYKDLVALIDARAPKVQYAKTYQKRADTKAAE